MCSTFETGHQLRVLSKNGRYVEKTLKQIKNKQNLQNKQKTTTNKKPHHNRSSKITRKAVGEKTMQKIPSILQLHKMLRNLLTKIVKKIDMELFSFFHPLLKLLWNRVHVKV